MKATMARWTRLVRVRVRTRVGVRVHVGVRVRVRVRVRARARAGVSVGCRWGAVDAPSRLPVGKGEEVRTAFVEE